MNGTEFLEGLGSLDNELLSEAESSVRVKSHMRWALPVAACLALGLGVMAAVHFASPKNNEAEAAVPYGTESIVSTEAYVTHETQAPTEAPEPTEAPRIVYLDGEIVGDEWYPDPGEINFSSPLWPTLNGEIEGDWDDCLFAVDISLTHSDGGLLEKLIHEAHVINQDPDNVRYAYAYWDWYRETYELREMTEEDVAAELGLTIEEFYENAPDGERVGQHLLWEAFEAWWKSEIPEDEFNACVAAHNRMLEANNAAWGERTQVKEVVRRNTIAELERLKALGLNVYINESGGISGYLTREELLNFPVSDTLGYVIYWQGEDNIIDE